MLIITVSIFVFVTLAVTGLYWLMFRPPSAATERLRRMGDAGGAPSVAPSALPDESPVGALAERMAAPFQRLAPPSAAEARKLQKQLMHAGFRSESGPVIFRAVQLLSLAFFPAFVALVCALWGRPLSSAFMWIAGAVAVGGYLPRFALKRMIASRQLRLRWGLADALDLMVVSIEAGLLICDLEILRLHYAETLKAWRERFLAHKDEVERIYDRRFVRMWEFYLACSEMAFREQNLMVMQYQLTKRQGVVPITRDYIAREEARLRGLES